MAVNYGSKRVVVGAHYGLRDWLAQRVTAFEGQLTLHSTDMKEIRDKVNQIENSITSVGAKVDAMQSLLMQIHEQLQHK